MASLGICSLKSFSAYSQVKAHLINAFYISQLSSN